MPPFEETCHRALAVIVGLILVASTATTAIVLYRPTGDEFVPLYWSVFAVVVLQACALQRHACFNVRAAWAGALSMALIGGYSVAPSLLALRYSLECHVDTTTTTPINDTTSFVAKATHSHSHDVNKALQFTTIVAAIASLVCIGRWFSVHIVMVGRRESALTTRRRRAAAARGVRVQPVDTDEEVVDCDDGGDDGANRGNENDDTV